MLSRFLLVLNRPLLVMVALLAGGCNMPSPVYGDPDPSLTVKNMTGVWESEDGAAIDLKANGDFVITDLPEDMWETRGIERLDIEGTWQLCSSSREDILICKENDSDVYLGIGFNGRSVTKDDATTEINKSFDNVYVTGGLEDLAIWFGPDTDDIHNPRYKFAKR